MPPNRTTVEMSRDLSDALSRYNRAMNLQRAGNREPELTKFEELDRIINEVCGHLVYSVSIHSNDSKRLFNVDELQSSVSNGATGGL